jgi:hypothetical protein
MSHPGPPSASRAGRRALRLAVWQAVAAVAVTAGLVTAVDAGAPLLGPVLIFVGSFWGAKALRDWWRHLDEEWFVAEVALVSAGWALLAAAFAAAQYVAFSFAPGAFYVDVDYAKLISPRYRVAWARDSSRTAAALADVERAAQLLRAGGPPSLALDSVYTLGGGASGQLTERCEAQLPLERCPWQVVVVPVAKAKPIEIAIAAPEGERGWLSGAELQQRLGAEMARLRGDLADYGRRMANPAAFVQPRIVDFLYDTGVAFSGNDAGVFVPISALARACKVVEFLASLLLFGIVVSRISAAASARIARR